MSSTSIRLIEYLALDGPIGPAPALVLGAGLLVLFGWALWRERAILGLRQTILFWVLRACALAAVLWMLLAPMNVRVETATTRQAVALLTDVSASMQTVDPAGTSDDLRWALATTNQSESRATISVDRAVAAINMAASSLQRAIQALGTHQPEGVVIEYTAEVTRAIERALLHLDQLQRATDASPELTAHIGALREMLTSSEFEAFDSLTVALKKGRTPSEQGWRESLPDLKHRLQAIRSGLQDLARQTVAAAGDQLTQQHGPQMAANLPSSRLGLVVSLLKHLEDHVLSGIRETADVQIAVFDESARRLAGSSPPDRQIARWTTPREPAAATNTDLAAALEQLNRDRQQQPLAAVILLSDMAHNQTAARDPRETASRLKDAPVFVVPIGNTQRVRDVILQSVYAPAVAMRNDEIVIEATLQAHDCAGEVCTVQLLQDGEEIDFREVVIDSRFASRTVRFEQLLPSTGQQQFQVAVTPLEGELTQENNYDEFDVNVTRNIIQVLLADEMPRWEYRYLAQLFRRDAKIECDELLFHPRMIATGRREQSRTLPVTVDEWDQYDVVLLGDLIPAHFPAAAQESLATYLKQRGGTLVLTAGPGAMPQAYVDHPLEELLPVRPVERSTTASAAGYAFRVTPAGRDHHALMIGESPAATDEAWDFVNRFAPLHAISVWRQPRPSAQTLIAAVPRDSADEQAAAADSAFLCWQPVGRGKVMYLSGPDSYRLRFLRGDRLHYRFWGQLLRWAIASDLAAGTEFVRVRTDKSRYNTRENVQVAVRLTDPEGDPVIADDLALHATSADSDRLVPLAPLSTIPGEYTAVLSSLSPGVYRIEPTGHAIDTLQQEAPEPAACSFTVQADLPQELVDTRCDRALAQQIADVTGGQVLPPTAIEEVLGLINLDPIVTERIERRPLWLEWKYLWIVVGCLQLEWIIRKWKGLS